MNMVLDKHLLETLYYDYSPRLVNYGMKMLGDSKSVEDVVQESYYRLWNRYSGTDKALAQWTSILFATVRNQCLDILRKRTNTGNMVPIPDDLCEVESLYALDFNNPNDGLQNTLLDELSAEITHIEENLGEMTRRIFLMSRVEKMKNREIAERLNISIKTVEKHITIALKAFRKQFEISGFLEK